MNRNRTLPKHNAQKAWQAFSLFCWRYDQAHPDHTTPLLELLDLYAEHDQKEQAIKAEWKAALTNGLAHAEAGAFVGDPRTGKDDDWLR